MLVDLLLPRCLHAGKNEEQVQEQRRPNQGPPNQRVGRTSNCISPLARPVRPPLRLDLGHPKAKEREGRNTVSVRQPTRVLSPKGAEGDGEENHCLHVRNATSCPSMT